MSDPERNGDDPGPTDHKDGDERESSHLVRLIKPVVVGKEPPGPIDASVVSPRFYGAFNYSVLSRGQEAPPLVLGVTSPGRGDGKTLVASNLAVSLATVQERRTVLVDLSVAHPVLHRIFGVHSTPGLAEALFEPSIYVAETHIRHLCVLPAGRPQESPLIVDRLTVDPKQKTRPGTPSFGLEHVAEFRNVLYSLKQEFDFIIVDMPAAKDPSVPSLLTHQMDGLLLVIDTNRTRQEDIERIFQRVNEKQILGFVFNRVREDHRT